MLQVPPSMTRVGYGIFIVLAVFSLIKHNDLMMAGSYLGIGLIFDPFNPAPWPERKLWQKSWCIVHMALTFGLFIYGWFKP